MSSIPLDTIVTAVACILSACESGYNAANPLTAQNSISQSCELKAVNATEIIKQDLILAELSLKKLANSINDLKNLRLNAAPNRSKRSTSSSQLNAYDDNFTLPEDCVGQNNGFFQISVHDQTRPFEVMCENNGNHGANWMIIANYHEGSMDFGYNAVEYTKGFENEMGDYFIGVERLYAITNSKLQELLMLLIDEKGIERHYAHYTAFGIADANKEYALNMLGVHSGDAANSLSSFIGRSIHFVHSAYTGHLKVLIRPREIE